MTGHPQNSRLSPEVLVVGETIIDLIECDGIITEHVGGSPANVALTLARLGNVVRFVTDVAHDARGQRAEQHLAASAVVVDSRTLSRTSTAHARLQADGSARYTFDISFTSQAVALGTATHVHTGSIAAFLQPSAQVVSALFDSLPVGVTSSLDPNIRPALLGERHATLDAFETLARGTDIVKLSDEDADWLYPGECLDAVLDRLLSLGVALAVMTRGGGGMTLASAAARAAVSAARVHVADTIGSGDSAMGAIIDIALRDGLDTLNESALVRIGNWAASVSGITTSRSGANPPWREDVTGLHSV